VSDLIHKTRANALSNPDDDARRERIRAEAAETLRRYAEEDAETREEDEDRRRRNAEARGRQMVEAALARARETPPAEPVERPTPVAAASARPAAAGVSRQHFNAVVDAIIEAVGKAIAVSEQCSRLRLIEAERRIAVLEGVIEDMRKP